MNTRYPMSTVSMIVAVVTTFASPAFASTILINFEKKVPEGISHAATKERQINGQGKSGNLSNVDELAEALLSQYLHRTGYTVITANELAPSQWLTAQEIRLGRSGKTIMLRKMAALHDACISFNALMERHNAREDFIGVKMSTNVIKISYKLVETASGKTIDIDSRKYISTARTHGYAQHGAIDKMAKDVAQMLSLKLSVKEMENAQAGLPKYKQK